MVSLTRSLYLLGFKKTLSGQGLKQGGHLPDDYGDPGDLETVVTVQVVRSGQTMDIF